MRREFLCRMIDCAFYTRAIVVDKPFIEDPLLRKSPSRFFKHIAKLLLEQHRGAIKEAKVIFDGKAVKDLPVFLRHELNLDENNRLIGA